MIRYITGRGGSGIGGLSAYLATLDDDYDVLSIDPEFLQKDWYPREAYIDEWTAFDLWVRRHSPDVKAFELLEWVDLGETRSSRDGVDGWIDFTDGVHPGNDSRFTDVDHLGASILQHRLNELNMGIEVALA